MSSIVQHWAAFQFVHWADGRIRSLGRRANSCVGQTETTNTFQANFPGKPIENECQSVLHVALVAGSRGSVTGQRWHPYGISAASSFVMAAILALVLIKILALVLALALVMVMTLVLAFALVLTLVIGSPRMSCIVQRWAAFESIRCIGVGTSFEFVRRI